ncbi:MAG TPA: NYN domain-containing protein [Candidatus Polarisedimenticolia bacterium]|nr:NYN domain-containing protein [Candidatus Polarisedimenticolia bacterium]
MLKAGIFLDVENLVRCGGWGIRYRMVKEFVQSQGCIVLRANAYMAIDEEREERDADYRRKKHDYRLAVRRAGFHLVLKKVQRYQAADGEVVMKANADLDLAVDALLQTENLDYVLLGTGDGDFIRLVLALQSTGKRVDLLSFSNTSSELRRTVDFHFSGYLVPGLLPSKEGTRLRGQLHAVNEEKGYGFLTVRTGMSVDDLRDDVFLHINDFQGPGGRPVDNNTFALLKTRETILEFELVTQPDGKARAVKAAEFVEPLGQER